uniref:Type I cytokine receptor cytokine-binding domain-containing protein n=1 Tax=Rhinolophus ferrumequinum TaxID=59479 RepID=A0A671E832_RHIFE
MSLRRGTCFSTSWPFIIQVTSPSRDSQLSCSDEPRLHRAGAGTGGAAGEHVLVFPGKEGSRAINFSCLIYNIRFMNCSWMPGPAAPADVQYHLYAWTSMYEDDEVECPHYLFGSTGTHVGCHFDTLAEPKSTDNYFFLVNGTSQETAIQFLDFTPFKATEMGKTISRLASPIFSPLPTY